MLSSFFDKGDRSTTHTDANMTSPFVRISNNFGDGSQQQPNHHYEHTPLRRRENDSYRGSSNAVHFGSNLPWHRRRYKSRPDTIVKYVMRGVLLSPVVVLVLWSMIAIMWGKKQQQQINAAPTRTMSRGRDSAHVRPMPHPRQALVVQPRHIKPVRRQDAAVVDQPMQEKQYQYDFPPQQKQYQYDFPPETKQYQYNFPPETKQYQYNFPPETQSQQVKFLPMEKQYQYNFPPETLQQQPQHHPIPFPVPFGVSSSYEAPYMTKQYQYNFPPEAGAVQPDDMNANPMATQQQMSQAQPYMNAASTYTQQTMSQSQPNMASTGTKYYKRNRNYNNGGSSSSNNGYAVYSSNSVSTTTTTADDGSTSQEIVAQELSNATTPHEHHPLPPLPPPPVEAGYSNYRVYYYDPFAISDEVPSTVFDTEGNSYALSDLDAEEIVIEPPPPAGMIHHNYTNATLINITYSHPNVVSTRHERKRTMSIGDIPSAWGSSTSTDQSIIVATVGVMALLVGAVSARRLRSRSILSACIENETLEDEVAYDTAYTVPNNNGAYNTFSQGWKDDMEKFDV